MTETPGSYTVQSVAALEALYPQPSLGVTLKVMDHLDDHLRQALSVSPLCFLATAGADGHLDCSPRGDAATAVLVQDDRTLLLPDRPGNNRLDSLRNIIQNPEVGLIFLLPGLDEVIRVNGRAHVSTAPALTGRFEINGKGPRSVVVVAVREAFMHCPRAFHTAQLWNPERHLPSDRAPDFAVMYEAHKQANAGKVMTVAASGPTKGTGDE